MCLLDDDIVYDLLGLQILGISCTYSMKIWLAFSHRVAMSVCLSAPLDAFFFLRLLNHPSNPPYKKINNIFFRPYPF